MDRLCYKDGYLKRCLLQGGRTVTTENLPGIGYWSGGFAGKHDVNFILPQRQRWDKDSAHTSPGFLSHES